MCHDACDVDVMPWLILYQLQTHTPWMVCTEEAGEEETRPDAEEDETDGPGLNVYEACTEACDTMDMCVAPCAMRHVHAKCECRALMHMPSVPYLIQRQHILLTERIRVPSYGHDDHELEQRAGEQGEQTQ